MARIQEIIDETGPITSSNYGKRASLHVSRRLRAGAQDDFPVANKQTEEGRKLLVLWEAYFRVHLGGYPYTFKRVLDDDALGFTVPEARPEIFDISWQPRGFDASVAMPKIVAGGSGSRDTVAVILAEPRSQMAERPPPGSYFDLVEKHGKPRGFFE